MYKKIIALIIGVVIVTAGIVGWKMNANSKYTNPTTCLEATVNEIDLMRSAWNTNLKSIMEQEKPTSKKVDESFESMRTYRCWLDYMCETVLFSGNADEKIMKGTAITKSHISPIAGCVAPSKIVIPTTKLKFIPQCKINKDSSSTPTLEATTVNFKKCKEFVALEFYADPKEKNSKLADSSSGIEAFKNRSSAYVGLERQLKASSAAQKSMVLRKKLTDIVTKMQVMEKNMIYLNKYIKRFDSLMPCYAAKCD